MNERQPERKLWQAVMNLALDDYKNIRVMSKAGWSSWLFSRDFTTVSDLSGFHPEYARKKFIKSRL